MYNVLIIGLTGQMGGTENYIYNLIKLIDRRKYSFDFLVIEDGQKTPYEEEINLLINDGRNHFYYCPNSKKNYIAGKIWLKKFYMKHHYDLIYMNATTAAKTFYCRYALEKQNIPMIMHSHRSNGRIVNHTLYKSYSNRHSCVKLACSRNAAEWMYGSKSSQAIIIPNGIDTDRFIFSESNRKQIRSECGYTDSDIVLGHVGRFSEEKNHKFLVELATRLDDKYKVLCIGEGPTKKNIQKMIELYGLEKKFTLLPVRKDVNRLYSAMDAFIMPSYNEGLPVVSVEAQCSGLKCLFSETVSKETNLSGKCEYIALDEMERWIETINRMAFERYDGVKAVTEAGFSMKNTAVMIENYFDYAISSKRSKEGAYNEVIQN